MRQPRTIIIGQTVVMNHHDSRQYYNGGQLPATHITKALPMPFSRRSFLGSPIVKINWDLYHMQISDADLCGRLKDGIDQLGYLQLADDSWPQRARHGRDSLQPRPPSGSG